MAIFDIAKLFIVELTSIVCCTLVQKWSKTPDEKEIVKIVATNSKVINNPQLSSIIIDESDKSIKIIIVRNNSSDFDKKMNPKAPPKPPRMHSINEKSMDTEQSSKSNTTIPSEKLVTSSLQSRNICRIASNDTTKFLNFPIKIEPLSSTKIVHSKCTIKHKFNRIKKFLFNKICKTCT